MNIRHSIALKLTSAGHPEAALDVKYGELDEILGNVEKEIEELRAYKTQVEKMKACGVCVGRGREPKYGLRRNGSMPCLACGGLP